MKKAMNLLTLLVLLVSCTKMDNNRLSFLNITSSSVTDQSDRHRHHTQLVDSSVTVYGALIAPPQPGKGAIDFQTTVAKEIGITCLRDGIQVPSKFGPQLLSTGYSVVLNLSTGSGTGRTFPTNLVKYKTDLEATVKLFSKNPAIGVIENEEANKIYFSGTPDQYIAELQVGIDVLHAHGIKVADGGINNTGINYLVYQDFLSQGKTDSAAAFKLAAHVVPRSLNTQNRADFVNTLLTHFAAMDLDYVNFHWKGSSPDASAFRSAINYLRKRTGKPIISNEMGQFDTDPATLTAYMKQAGLSQLAYALWYSPDFSDNKKDYPLQYSNTTLTKSGLAYQTYLK